MKLFAKCLNRRSFLKTSGAGIALTALGLSLSSSEVHAANDFDVPEKILSVDTTRCTGCRKCEIVCSVLNRGNSNPKTSGIKVGRNYGFGQGSSNMGMWNGEGQYGNFRIVPETCNQCKEPVVCADVCPQDAIVEDENTGARIVNEDECIGCEQCVKACPWEMIKVDPVDGIAAKCNLCFGSPQCAANCPTEAIKLISWRDLSGRTPIRNYSSIL
ncbi:4Fe-4S dicluster domain-containing protein [Natranaerofaba carboxydovora]|uniref:4Fe-4S dicluster domain-containing protein n=1 Tax=Natranaerofaba carboxydovora TaxID=2742683 RepID=UPI001F1341AE|nr:4Fe-4S dicluster domain-containing protein [Natranaerofaba carboxydovora]UMZ72905.1 putative ferredoxin-like protein YdhY [Natranaerofaba carboxydovora]